MFKYNPKRIAGSWTPSDKNNPVATPTAIKMEAFMNGVFITCEFDEAQVTYKVGGSGELTAILNPNATAKLVATFVQGSPTNDALSTKVASSARNYFPSGPIQLRDLNGTTYVNSKDAFLEKFTKVEFGNDLTGRQWTWILPDAVLIAGGDGS